MVAKEQKNEDPATPTPNTNETEKDAAPTPWPNQTPVVDGVTPVSEVPQDPNLFDDDDDLDAEMK